MAQRYSVVILALVSAMLSTCASAAQSAPNIIFVVADDIGWNDVSWHNSEMVTPNLEALARAGIILDRSYVQPMCSPSRSAFMTGQYPFHTGLQHEVIGSMQAAGVPLHLSMLPQVLQNEAGYATHMVGKWHLGFCNWQYTPIRRGFQSFLGYYLAFADYYTHMAGQGYDFRVNESVALQFNGTYSSFAFAKRAEQIVEQHDNSKPLFLYLPFQSPHSPLQVPRSYLNRCSHIKSLNRRTFCAMIALMDEAVGNVTTALKKRAMMDNTVIIFTTDNGGTPSFSGNNWPLRGAKTTLWEGGTRGPAFFYGPKRYSPLRNYTNNQLIHAVDWFPTILELAGVNVSEVLNYTIDGVSQLNTLRQNVPTRTEMVYNIDELSRNAAIRVGNYKLIVGNPGNLSSWYPPPEMQQNTDSDDEVDLFEESEVESDPETPVFEREREIRLFDVESDPTESFDVSTVFPELVRSMLLKLANYRKTLVPAQFPSNSPNANPKLWNNTWSPGWC